MQHIVLKFNKNLTNWSVNYFQYFSGELNNEE